MRTPMLSVEPRSQAALAYLGALGLRSASTLPLPLWLPLLGYLGIASCVVRLLLLVLLALLG